jgi:hypothetical protein
VTAVSLRRAAPATRVRPQKRVRTWEWSVAGVSLVMLYGAHLDAWAHVHVGEALETVLTPWHFVVYGSFAALTFLLGFPVLARLARGRSVRTAYARSYTWSLVGGAVFVTAGGLDLAWHVAFGIEVGVEALLSPTHLGLALGAGMLWSGPLLAAWRRSTSGRSLADLGPALIALSAVTGLAAFTTHFASPLVDAWPTIPFSERDPRSWYVPGAGFASLVIYVAVLTGAALLLLRRWPAPPFGALATLVVASGIGLPFLHDRVELIAVPVITAVLAEALLAVLRRRASAATSARVMSAALPVAFATTSLIVLELADRLRWTPHLIAGYIVLAAMTGLVVGLLVFPPRLPGVRVSDRA